MGRAPTDGLKSFYDTADAGGDIRAAWLASGKPTTFKNARRAYLKYTSTRASAETQAAATTAATTAAAKKKRQRKKDKEAATLSPRLKPSAQKKLRLPSRIVAERRADKQRHDA
eukprot:3382575-Prymnesium_polylepis.1